MDIEKLRHLRIQHNNPTNWYSKACKKCKKKKYLANRITKPEIDEELGYCFSCAQKHIYDHLS